MSTFTIETTFATCCCASCGIQYAIPERRQRELRENHETFYCPNGHTQWYPQKSEAEKLRDELKRKEQELANTAIEKLQLKKELELKIKQRDKKLKRLTNGVCSCCNRSFVNLHQHMKKQHPEEVSKKR